MRVFVTGASGWVGSALVPDLIRHGHSVAGLARTPGSAAAVQAAGAEVVSGTLDDLEVLTDAAASADAVVHLGFKHDIAFSGDYSRAARDDRTAIDALARGVAHTDKALVVASGLLGVVGVGAGVVATEADGRFEDPAGATGGGRIATARHVVSLARSGIRSVVVRLPPATHGAGDNGFTAAAVAAARKAGVSAYAGAGTNRWPAVHRDDAADLFRLAVESAPPGTVLHAVAEEGVPIRAVAEAIGAGLGVPAVSVAPPEIPGYLGFLGGFWTTDGPAKAQVTRDLVGWEPTGPGWLEDLRSPAYYRS